MRLAAATAASASGGVDELALTADAEARLEALGIADTGWRNAYVLAMGVPA